MIALSMRLPLGSLTTSLVPLQDPWLGIPPPSWMTPWSPSLTTFPSRRTRTSTTSSSSFSQLSSHHSIPPFTDVCQRLLSVQRYSTRILPLRKYAYACGFINIDNASVTISGKIWRIGRCFVETNRCKFWSRPWKLAWFSSLGAASDVDQCYWGLIIETSSMKRKSYKQGLQVIHNTFRTKFCKFLLVMHYWYLKNCHLFFQKKT